MPSEDVVAIRPHYHDRIRREVFALVPRLGGALLDVGGGVGATAVALKNAGYVERAGVVDQVHQNAEKTGLDFHFSGDLEDPATLRKVAAEGPFHVILCLDILEHLADPWQVIRQLGDALAPAGVIVASIPNMRHFTASFPFFFLGRWDLEAFGIRDRTHLRWFVRSTAIELMTSSGLELEVIVDKPSLGRRTWLIRALTLGLFRQFTVIQFLIRVRKAP